ncbi:MAG: restriction endonuclease [candidate division WOR-3 bacterium]
MRTIDEIQEIIDAYNKLVGSIDTEATQSKNGRAYGGIVRAGKGKLVESIAKVLITIAWQRLKQEPNRLKIIGKQIKIPIRPEYIDSLADEIKDYIRQNIQNYYYHYKPDILVAIDDKPIMAVECKAYTENAMLKRILVDATLLKSQYPSIQFVLLQLESQLGGDFSQLKDVTYGSPATHTLLSYFDVDLNIITLLKGERRVDRPIHKAKFFKPLMRSHLEIAVKTILGILQEFI